MRKIATSIMVVAILLVVFATGVSAQEYEVKKGDNLWDIAIKYQTTVDKLVSLNELQTTVIQPKQKINVQETYIVEKGDTLSHIAKDYNVKVKEIKKWNDLESDLILIGQELEIKKLEPKASEPKQETAEKATKQPEATPATTKQPTQENTSNNNKQKSSSSSRQPEGKTFQVTATAYTAECDGCSGITYTGVNLLNDRNKKVIAVDPNVIPLGTKVYVEGYGHAVAEDIGSAIKGNKIDLHVPTKREAYDWGVRTVNITILD